MESIEINYLPKKCCVCMADVAKTITLKIRGADRSLITQTVPVCQNCSRKYNIRIFIARTLLLASGIVPFIYGYMSFLGSTSEMDKYGFGVCFALIGLIVGIIIMYIIRQTYSVKIDAYGKIKFRNKEYLKLYEEMKIEGKQ